MTRMYDADRPAFTHALDVLRPELAALPGDNLEPIRLDIVPAVVAALGVLASVKRFRAQVASELGETAATHIDRLETTAQACGRAHAIHLTLIHGTGVEAMAGELSKTRKILLLEAESLVAQKRLTSTLLGSLVGGTGYKQMCGDVIQIVSALRGEWPAIESFTGVKTLELDRAEALANEVATIIGENEMATSPSSPSADLRQRAYTLFVRTYDQVRRQIGYLRWEEGDADEIAPSLFAGRRARKHDDDESVDPLPIVSPTNGAGPVMPGMPGAPPFVTS
jgi:hypothetical protein